MLGLTLSILVLFPFLIGGICLFATREMLRNILIAGNSLMLIAASVFFAFNFNSLSVNADVIAAFNVDTVIKIADVVLLLTVGYFGVIHKHWPIMILAVLQIILLFILEVFMLKHTEIVPFVFVDMLAVIMVLIVCIVGSIISLFGIPYMRKHEAHLGLTRTRQNKFFAVIIMFLGAMNGLVISNNMMHLYFFFEFTTLCSFLLIGHDRTFAATRNALKALWMNSLGGLALLIAIVLFYTRLETLDIGVIIDRSFNDVVFLLPLTMLCLAAFIKAAQPPFQGWLLGAMVAPTPTSALLHSSTMVKVGVYLAIRFSPAYVDSILATSVALFGAFVFVSSALSAIGQSNGKKVLAYSTVSNLGLIFACAGIGTAEAITAGILLIVFHAVSKALLFLCVGTVEQKIGSRDIEDMRGIYKIMPVTSLIMLVGIISIILPPFGMLLGKWMAMEAASSVSLVVVAILAVGSAATVLYWARWAGVLLSYDKGGAKVEKQEFLTRYSLLTLCSMAVLFGFAAPLLFTHMIVPVVNVFGVVPFNADYQGIFASTGAFWVAPLFVVFTVAGLAAFFFARSNRKNKKIKEYMCGINADEDNAFTGPAGTVCPSIVHNYYFVSFCSEETSAKFFNCIALLFIAFMVSTGIYLSNLGGVWQ